MWACSGRVRWASAPSASLRSPDSGRRFWAFVTTIPLTLLTLASLVAALQSEGPRGAWWLTAVLIVLVERGATFGYFIPTLLRLQRGSATSETVVHDAVARWMRLNYLRSLITLLAWLAALNVLSMR